VFAWQLLRFLKTKDKQKRHYLKNASDYQLPLEPPPPDEPPPKLLELLLDELLEEKPLEEENRGLPEARPRHKDQDFAAGFLS